MMLFTLLIPVSFGAPPNQGHAIINEIHRIARVTESPIIYVEAADDCGVPDTRSPNAAGSDTRNALHLADSPSSFQAAWNSSGTDRLLSMHVLPPMTVLVLAGKKEDCTSEHLVPSFWDGTVEAKEYAGKDGLRSMLASAGLEVEATVSHPNFRWVVRSPRTLADVLAHSGEWAPEDLGGAREYSLIVDLGLSVARVESYSKVGGKMPPPTDPEPRAEAISNGEYLASQLAEIASLERLLLDPRLTKKQRAIAERQIQGMLSHYEELLGSHEP